MKLNFKYYNTQSLVLFTLAYAFIYGIAKKIIANNITLTIPDYLKTDSEILVDTLGWLSPVFILSIILFVINEYGWKCKLFKWLVDLPNLNGRYKGELISSFKDEKGNFVTKDCVIEIKQNASSISVFSYYADKGIAKQTSMARSVSEQIVKEPNGNYVLHYIFTNEPDSMLEMLNKHNGTAKFTYFEDKKMIQGEYYNHRLNKGTMTLTFVQDKLLHRYEE
jgi:hypothetical protein